MRMRGVVVGAVVLILGLQCVPVRAGWGDYLAKDPWFTNPVLRGLMEWVTFYLPFDAGNMIPEMAAGDPKPTVGGTPQFAPGIRGLSLVAGGGGTGNAGYSTKLNFPIGTRGAMAMWVCPVEWTHVRGGNTVFAMTANSTFYIERQGPDHNDRGELVRAECVLFLVNTKSSGSGCITFGTRDWPAGKWRLLVANWNWPEMSFSLDGGAFQPYSLKRSPDPSEFASLVIGSPYGEKTLIDEVMIFRRPLSDEECRELYRAFVPEPKGGEK